MKNINYTDFKFKNCTNIYFGKVRDAYTFDDKLVIVCSDRISAFDQVLPRTIPYKGQVLNQIASYFLKSTQSIVPNWMIDSPHPNISYGKKCMPFKIEMVIRGYLSGHAWRHYKEGNRNLCGNILPENLRENGRLSHPIITPTTKNNKGHDEDIPPEKIIENKIISKKDYEKLEHYTRSLFQMGTEMAKNKNLILVDTKYEFGIYREKIHLIDEIHTPDSSRYFYADTYEDLQSKNLPQKQLSKEFVREWLLKNNFINKIDYKLKINDLPEDFIEEISERYIHLYENILKKKFVKYDKHNILTDISNCIEKLF